MCVFLSNATILPTYAYSETTLAKIKALDLSKENDINQYIKYKDEIHDRYYKLKSSGKSEEAREVLDEIKQIDNYMVQLLYMMDTIPTHIYICQIEQRTQILV